jgi:hypothetical protein
LAFATKLDASTASLNRGPLLSSRDGFVVTEVPAAMHDAWQEAAIRADIPLALSDLALWESLGLGPGKTLCEIHDSTGRIAGGFAVHRWPVGALPGHSVLRLERLGESVPKGAEPALVSAVHSLALRTPFVLQVAVELHDRDAVRRSRIAKALADAGYRRLNTVRTYERTLAIDLQRDDDSLLASFSTRARRELRRAGRYALSVIPIDDERFVGHLEAIHRETFSRTRAQARPEPWATIIAGSRRSPSRLRIFGAMLADGAAGPRLVAFARVLRHGTFAVYDTAGSTRLADRRVPLMYPVVWEVLRWARDSGAHWFDFGGVSSVMAEGSYDPVAGISEFKRNFGGEEMVVGENWQCDIAPVRQKIVQSLRVVWTSLTRRRR